MLNLIFELGVIPKKTKTKKRNTLLKNHKKEKKKKKKKVLQKHLSTNTS